MKFYVLPVGNCEDDKGKVFTPGKDEGLRVVAPNWAGLIQTQELNILIDTGMHPIHIENPYATFKGTQYEDLIIPKMNKEDSILYQLDLLKLKPNDIDFVINTHLHFDHSGCNAFFPNATFLVQREHYRYALDHPEAFPPKYFLVPGLNYQMLDGEMTFIPGIELICAPGHVPGMMCVILRFEKGKTIVIASDAISLKESLEEDLWEGFWNPILAKNSAKRLASITAAENGELFFGHDPDWWKSIKISPKYYE